MSNYSNDPSSVRVDFFKSSGKWYTTEAVQWNAPYVLIDNDGEQTSKFVSIIDAFERALERHLKRHAIKDGKCRYCDQPSVGDVNAATYCAQGRFRLAGMTAVCLEPYHESAHPLMVKVPGSDE